VALTRAKCSVVTWWAPSRNTPASALQRFLYRPPEAGADPAACYPLTGDPRSLPRLQAGFAVEPVGIPQASNWQRPPTSRPVGHPRTFDRTLDLQWRRASYSSLTAAAYGMHLKTAGVGSEPEPAKEDDETWIVPDEAVGGESEIADVVPISAGLDGPAGNVISPMQDLPVGVEFGTVVHTVLEGVDPQADDLAGELRTACAAALSRTSAGVSAEALSNALLPVMQTPLGPLAGDRRLCDMGRPDRLTELTFELPLVGGDQPTADLRLAQLGPVLRRHLRHGDLLHGYPQTLEHPALAEEPLRGYLNGSIDAVIRVHDGGVPRYLVVDYKTNWLGRYETGPLLVTEYTPGSMASEMIAAHYPLQALLYSVALHRLLRWRQPEYEPHVHLGGVLYLFLRGMAGPQTPRVDGVPCGVFSWQPPVDLITELSDLLQGVAR
jgi:exodeoxyribonuclease V beta subunit